MQGINNFEGEVLAVISAVIAAMNERNESKIVVKSIRRVPQTVPVWGAAGRIDRLS